MLHELGATDLEYGDRSRGAAGQDRHGAHAARDARQPAAARRCARRTGVHAERRRDGARCSSSAPASTTTTGKLLAPVDVVLETDSRKPAAKHAILEMYVQHGLELPDTPTMALHRGRIDLLEEHLRRDPELLRRTFSHGRSIRRRWGATTRSTRRVGTPLGGTTLLHMCVDYDEMEIARWLLDRGMDVNARAAVDATASADTRRCSRRSCRSRTSG